MVDGDVTPKRKAFATAWDRFKHRGGRGRGSGGEDRNAIGADDDVTLVITDALGS